MQNIFLLSCLVVFFSCAAENNHTNSTTHVVNKTNIIAQDSTALIFKSNIVTEIGSDIRCILQDSKNNYWFGTDNGGVYRYNGNTLLLFTTRDGLADDQIQIIQEDNQGNIWFGTGGFGVTRFDGKTFTTFTNNKNLTFEKSVNNSWSKQANDMWFYGGGGTYRYSNHSFEYLPFAKADSDSFLLQSAASSLSKYGVYSFLKDKNGNLWFGTQTMGVCMYNGSSFKWFTEKGLNGPAVRALFEDSKGNFWFGNNGSGLFMYNGNILRNITDEKGLGNPEFFTYSSVSKKYPGTMARVWTINEDNYSNLWIGTIDAGVWKYDGDKLTNYTTVHGLPSDAILVIYKDKNGELWFGAEGKGVYKFNGTSFIKFDF